MVEVKKTIRSVEEKDMKDSSEILKELEEWIKERSPGYFSLSISAYNESIEYIFGTKQDD